MQTVPLPDCWVSTDVDVRPSSIEGGGLFAGTDLPADDVVVRLGGRLVSDAELRALFDAQIDTLDGAYIDTVSIDDDRNLVLPAGSSAHFGNHRCEPNLWWVDPYSLATRLPVSAGSELTLDYGTVTDDAGFRMACACGSRSCRETVTGTDWMRADLQAAYGEHWVPVLRARIAAARVSH